MKTRLIETKFWKDAYITDLSIEERLLYLYFLTNERVNIIHCYEITDREIVFDTGIDRGIIEVSKKKFQTDKKFMFYKNYVYLVNAYKYESYTGEMNDTAKLKLYKQMPEDVFNWYRGIYRGIAIPPINHKSETIDHKEETKSERISKKEIEEIAEKIS